MTALVTGFLRGTAAGAAGTTAIDVATRTDVVLRGRPPSETPADTVTAITDRLDTSIPGNRRQRSHRIQALGGLAGTATGVGVGALAGLLRATGIRLPTVIGGPLLGAGAMAASDVSMAWLRVTHPRHWTRTDWVADALPHLVYGITTHATLVSTFAADEHARVEHPDGTRRDPTAGTLLRAAALGLATGARSSAGMAALAWRARPGDPGASGVLARRGVRFLPVLTALGEAGADKHPSTPPRSAAPGLAPRLVLAAGSAETMARRDHREGGPAVLVATAGALGGALAGERLRAEARRIVGSDLPGALVEDAVTAVLAWAGSRRPARIPH